MIFQARPWFVVHSMSSRYIIQEKKQGIWKQPTETHFPAWVRWFSTFQQWFFPDQRSQVVGAVRQDYKQLRLRLDSRLAGTSILGLSPLSTLRTTRVSLFTLRFFQPEKKVIIFGRFWTCLSCHQDALKSLTDKPQDFLGNSGTRFSLSALLVVCLGSGSFSRDENCVQLCHDRRCYREIRRHRFQKPHAYWWLLING